jgi:hypothetical protein
MRSLQDAVDPGPGASGDIEVPRSHRLITLDTLNALIAAARTGAEPTGDNGLGICP